MTNSCSETMSEAYSKNQQEIQHLYSLKRYIMDSFFYDNEEKTKKMLIQRIENKIESIMAEFN